MPNTSAINNLPPEVRAWFDELLASRPFIGYEAVAEALKAKGYAVSKSAVHRHSKAVKTRQAHTASSETARALCIVAAAIKGAEDVENTAQRYLSWVQHG